MIILLTDNFELNKKIMFIPQNVAIIFLLRIAFYLIVIIYLTEVFRKTKDTYGQLDLVVNNAGIVNEKNWQQCIDVNLVTISPVTGHLSSILFFKLKRQCQSIAVMKMYLVIFFEQKVY